ncbi:MAG: AAA family ATPase, partial [Anaerolineales bacterium]|nr:AAA family ATPase [Anaerolineales bacterium]
MKQDPQIIQDLLPDEQGSYGVIAGRTGIGKTNLVLHLAHCLATGTPFFNLECQEVDVAVVAFEGDQKNLLDRLNKIKATFPEVGNRLMFEVMPIQNPIQMLKDLRKKLKNSRAQVVILDPIKYLVIGNYLSPKDVAPFVQMFQEMLTELGMCAVVTLPISKP